MSDFFASYAETAAPHGKAEKPPSKLDLKLQEKQRLSRAYRKMRAADNRAILAQEPRLAAFAKFVRRAAADEIVDAVRDSWLPQAPPQVRLHALRIVNARCDAADRRAGFEPLDDPLPPASSCFFRVREVLGAR